MARFRDHAEAVAWLRSPAAIRSRCGDILAAAERGALRHFAVDGSRLDDAAGYVVETTKAAYPALDIPYHSRWRHFSAGGVDRWGALADRLAGTPPDQIARIRIDLAVTSVLLDAGAGDRWRYREPGGDARYGRSEGLALASFHLFASGAFSAVRSDPLRADGAALAGLDAATLAAGFQVGDDNPLVGLRQRTELLRRLGSALAAEPGLFGTTKPRIGNLFDYLAGQARDGRLPATAILGAVLRGFGAIWPGRICLGGVNLGDVWRHPVVRTGDLTDRLVPFHKLSQWLTYSLVEPLEDAGLVTTDLDALTGLAEYRNGGLFVDLGVLCPKHDSVLSARHRVDSELVVEWRALTVALLDRLASEVRARLGLDAAALPLAKVLEGGTWRAGRRIARERRPGGGPPIRLDSDGTVIWAPSRCHSRKGLPVQKNVVVVDHPLVRHKLTLMRRKTASTVDFRRLMREIGALLAYEVTRDLPLVDEEIETPLAAMQSQVLEGKKLCLVSILRAGTGLLDGMLDLLPAARVGHIGLYRDPQTLVAVEYYYKVPEDLHDRMVIVVDPMLATGNSAVAAVQRLKESGAGTIKFVCVVAAPEGVAAFQEAHPDVPVFTAAVDRRLDDHGYIVPGLGDAGDRLYGTK